MFDDRLKNEFEFEPEPEQKVQQTKKHQSSSSNDEDAREAEEDKKRKENERMEKEKLERERANMQNAIDDRFNRLLKQERIQTQKEQQERNQKDKDNERNMKIVEGWAKASKDQGKSLSLVEVQFTWEKTAQKVCIEVRLFFGVEILRIA